MTFKELKNKVKEEQKDLAQKIKEQKGKRKSSPCGYVEGLIYNRFRYRHVHIAYCTFFNQTPYDKIETKCHEKPLKSTLETYRKNWEIQIDEALRDCA